MKKQLDLLLVEDNNIDVMFLEKAFSEVEGAYQINLYHDEAGDRALQYFEDDASRFDLIILDISLPGRNGFEVLEIIRNHESLEYTPVIMLSNSKLDDDFYNAMKLGANAFLLKPNTQEGFKNIAQSTIDFWSLNSLRR